MGPAQPVHTEDALHAACTRVTDMARKECQALSGSSHLVVSTSLHSVCGGVRAIMIIPYLCEDKLGSPRPGRVTRVECGGDIRPALPYPLVGTSSFAVT